MEQESIMSNLISQHRRGSLQKQLILWMNIALIALTIVAISYDYYTQKNILTINFHNSMKQAADHIILALENSKNLDSATNTLRVYCHVMSGHEDPYHEISLINETGEVIVSSKIAHAGNRKHILSNIPKELTWDNVQIENQVYIGLTLPFEKQWPDSHFRGTLRYIENTTPIITLLERLFWNRVISLMVVVFTLSLITFWILKRKVLNPLDRIFIQSYAVSTGDYESWNVPDPGNEIGDIQIMFNYMIEKIRIHEDRAVTKGRHSATVETIAQAYQAVINGISKVRTMCNSINQEKGGTSKRLLLQTGIIKNETDSILDNLSTIIEKIEGDTSGSKTELQEKGDGMNKAKAERL
jgi:methyl-accepting chemotaxis protein